MIQQVQALLPQGDHATLLAVDGDRVGDVERQLRRLPADATHLVISVGGNDALDHLGLLVEKASSFAQVLDRLADIGAGFGTNYREMLQSVLQHRLPTTICTIYDGNLDAMQQRLASAALTIFNDAILRAAFEIGVPVIDLRLICNECSDYANEIEPSSAGGAKIARAIINVTVDHDFSVRRSAVFT